MHLFWLLPLLFTLSLAVKSSSGDKTPPSASPVNYQAQGNGEWKEIPEKAVKSSPSGLLIMLQRKHPHVYMQVIKIKEQVTVNSKQQEMTRSAIASDQLFKMH